MPGFFVSNALINIDLKNACQKNCVCERIASPQFTVARNTLNKFMNDKVFLENNEFIVILEGYLLNKIDLFKEYGVLEMLSLVCTMFEQIGETFFCKFRGSFSGALFIKSDNKWIFYTNQMGDSPVFYLYADDVFFVGSQVNYLIDAAREKNVRLTFNEQAAYQMLTFAFMEGNDTYANEIKRLRGGMYMVVHNGNLEIKEYHMFHKHEDRFSRMTESEIIDQLDIAFRNAVKLEYEKDREYGYEHLYDMSGGLDSRMGAWVAHDMTDIHMQCMTYCKANYMDELIAKQISMYWNDELMVKPLDDISFMYDVDDVVFMLGGASLYTGITGGNRFLKNINTDLFGLEHTGMLGDVIIGSYCCYKSNLRNSRITGRYSEKLSSRLTRNDEGLYDDHELYLLYSRGFRGMMSSYLIRKNYIEPSSPFCDVDFFQLCMDIPIALRRRHKIYQKWILEKYPEAAKFKWEATGAKIPRRYSIKFIKRAFTMIFSKFLGIFRKNYILKDGMNPLDYWYNQNLDIQNFYEKYKEDNMRYIPEAASEQFKADMDSLFTNGTVLEKSMVLTVLSSLKLFFGDE